MKKLMILAIALLAAAVVAAVTPEGRVRAATDCTFTVSGTTMTLDGDCTTDATIVIPDGFTLDGAGHTITAMDPPGGHFTGAVIANGGTTAHVTNVTVTASGLVNVCDAGANRLRGIMFDGASGSITENVVVGINQGASGCQEGNAIEVRNAPFDGTHPNTQVVKVSRNHIDDYQKTGIVANGDVNVEITRNFVGSADLKDYIAANSIQVGFGAQGSVNNNTVLGNQWDKVSSPQWVATAVLVYEAGNVTIAHNVIRGEGTDIGVCAYASGTVNVMNNVIARSGDVGNIDFYGYAVDFWANSGKSKLVRNTFSGWNLIYEDGYGPDLEKVNTVEP